MPKKLTNEDDRKVPQSVALGHVKEAQERGMSIDTYIEHLKSLIKAYQQKVEQSEVIE